MDLLLFPTNFHMWKNLVCLLELRVWFVNELLASKISLYIDIRYLIFKMWMRNVPAYSQFGMYYFLQKKLIVFSLFQHLNEAFFIVRNSRWLFHTCLLHLFVKSHILLIC